MLERRNQRQKFRVLLAHAQAGSLDSAGGRACRTLAEEFADRNIETVMASALEDARATIVSDAAIHAMLIDWSLPDDSGKSQNNDAAISLITLIRSRNENVPIFLLTERDKAKTLNVELVQAINELVWLLEDVATFVGGRVQAAMHVVRTAVVQPGARIFVAYARPYRRHRLPEASGRPRLLRFLWRACVSHRPFHQRRRTRLLARPQRADRR